MRLPFELSLGLRYLRPKRTFVSVITVISVIGVMLGVAVLIVVISVMSGFDRQLREKILGFSAHLRISSAEGPLSNHAHWMEIVRSNRQVKAVAPYVLGQVMLKSQSEGGKPRFAAPWLRGIDPELEGTVSALTTNVVRGKFHLGGESLIVGSELARRLGIAVGDIVSVYGPRHYEEMDRTKGRENEVIIPADDYTVTGIFDVGYYEYNANVIVTSLENAQKLYQLSGQVHGLMVMLNDPEKVADVRLQLRQVLGLDFDLEAWTEENTTILRALAVEKNMMFYILFIIVLVAAFGIMNSQITFVVQKTREIGILKALGATRWQLLNLFLGQSLVVGVIGVASGLGLGLVMLSVRNDFLHFMNRWTGMQLFPPEIYAFTDLPALIAPRDIAMICGAALISCVLAGLAPAWNAGRLRPVEALRHE